MNDNSELLTKATFVEGMEKLKMDLTTAFTTAITAAITDAVDGLAGLINKSFIELEKRMATKDDARTLEGRVGSLERKVEGLERKVDGLDMHLSAYAARWNRDFDGHEIRIRTLEKSRP